MKVVFDDVILEDDEFYITKNVGNRTIEIQLDIKVKGNLPASFVRKEHATEMQNFLKNPPVQLFNIVSKTGDNNFEFEADFSAFS